MGRAIPFRDRAWYRLLWCLLLGAISATSMPPYCTPGLILGLSFFWLNLTELRKKWHAQPVFISWISLRKWISP